MDAANSSHALGWLYALLGWIGGAATTVVGSIVASRIRVYDDNRKSHRDELRARMLEPLRDGVREHLPLFAHRVPVIVEVWGYHSLAINARVDEPNVSYGPQLQAMNPWPAIFGSTDRALLEDARATHFAGLMGEASAIASAW